LVFPLLEFLEENTAYEDKEVQHARLELLAPTNMVDYAIEIHTALTGETEPKEMSGRRDAVFETMESLESKLESVRQVLRDQEQVDALRQEGCLNPTGLLERHEFSAQILDEFYVFAKFLYECGDYQEAHDMLELYLEIYTGINTKHYLDALWGKFASEILLKNWENALVDLLRIKANIDERSDKSPLEQLQQRSWLLHWSLFVFFNHDKGHDGIIDLFLSDKYLQAIQTNCPWLLRYLATAVIINKRRRSTIKDLVRIVTQEFRQQHTTESSTLSISPSDNSNDNLDPVITFIDCLYSKFDFEGAQKTLRECEKALRADYFLCNCASAFMEDARICLHDAYCRIHTKVDITDLAAKLDMDALAAERWIADLIRGALLDAKIDSQNSCVIMNNQFPSVYSQVIDKTRDLFLRSNALINNIDLKILANDRKIQAQQLAAAATDRD